MKRRILVLAAIILIAAQLACAIGQSSPASTPDPDATFVPMLYPDHITPKAGIGSTPSVAPTTPEVIATSFLQPIPEDYSSNNIASPDSVIYPIGMSGTVYAVVIEQANAGVIMGEGISIILNLGAKDGKLQFGIIETLGESEFRYDGGGIAVLDDYHPVVSLDKWYETANPQLAAEIKELVKLIKAKRLCLAPASSNSTVYLCRPNP